MHNRLLEYCAQNIKLCIHILLASTRSMHTTSSSIVFVTELPASVAPESQFPCVLDAGVNLIARTSQMHRDADCSPKVIWAKCLYIV